MQMFSISKQCTFKYYRCADEVYVYVKRVYVYNQNIFRQCLNKFSSETDSPETTNTWS